MSKKLFTDMIHEFNEAHEHNELFEASNVDSSTLNWNNADLNTPFIREIIKDYADDKNISTQEAEDKIKESMSKTENYLKQTPKMSVTALKSVTEQVIFDFLPDTSEEEFTLKVLKKLFTYVEGTYARFFPLRDGNTGKILTPSIHITPSLIQQPKWMTGVETAAASAEADIVFNKKFAQDLIYYARKKHVQGTAAFYESQGGDIPDSYVYIEFLIQHELGHVLRGDQVKNTNILTNWLEKNKDKYPKLIKKFGGNARAAAHRVNNFAADFIMNYRLVENGLPQLPIGLFSEDINYAKVKKLSDMWKTIMGEMEDQTPEAQEEQKNQMDDHLSGQDNANEKQQDDSQGEDAGDQDNQQGQDGQQGQDSQDNQQGQDGQQGQDSQDGQQGQQGQDNQDNQDGEQGQQGQQGQDGEPQDGQDGQQGQQGQQGQDGQQGQQGQDGEPQDGQDNQQGQDSGDQGDLDSSESDAQEKDMAKDQNEVLNNRQKTQEQLKQDVEDAKKEMERIKAADTERKLKDLKSRTGSKKEQIDKEYKPKFNWKTLLKKMMPSGDTTKEDTWSKISRRNSAGLKQLKDRGIAASKQGQVDVDSDKKDILFIVDNSGSVSQQISKVNKEIQTLIEKHKDGIRNFWVIKFDSNFSAFKVDLKDMKVQEYTNGKDILKPKARFKGAKLPLKTLFKGDAGGTDFGPEITKIAKTVLSDDGNVILFTDSDITWESNFKNIMFLITKYGKKPFQFNILLATKRDFDEFVALKAYKYLSYLDL